MAYRLINLGQFDGIFLPSRDEIESIAEQLGLTISFVEAGPGFNVTGFALSIERKPVSRSHVVLPVLICDPLSMDEQREFLHGEYIGVSHDQKVWA